MKYEAEKIAKAAFEDRLSKDVSDTLKKVETESKRAIAYFLFTVIAAILAVAQNSLYFLLKP